MGEVVATILGSRTYLTGGPSRELQRDRGEVFLDVIEEQVHFELNPNDDDCFMCGGEGFIEGECTCGDDTCCCLEPTPPECPECRIWHAKVKRAVQVEVLRSLDIDVGIAWLKQNRKWSDAITRERVLCNLYAGRVAHKEFTDEERADSACWVEGLL